MPRYPELDVMLSPARAWRRLAKTPATGNWVAGPLFVAFTLGCAISLIASGRLPLRLVLAGTLCGSFVPILEIISLAVVCRDVMPWRRAAELFFTGHGPWTLWLIGSATLWVLFPAPAMFRHNLSWKLSAIPVGVWSAYLDLQFFRKVCGGAALRRLIAQRLICWVPGLLIFVAPAGWQTIAGAVGI
jgi:hypothetical protein